MSSIISNGLDVWEMLWVMEPFYLSVSAKLGSLEEPWKVLLPSCAYPPEPQEYFKKFML